MSRITSVLNSLFQSVVSALVGYVYVSLPFDPRRRHSLDTCHSAIGDTGVCATWTRRGTDAVASPLPFGKGTDFLILGTPPMPALL